MVFGLRSSAFSLTVLGSSPALGQTAHPDWDLVIVADNSETVDGFVNMSASIRQWGPTDEVFIVTERRTPDPLGGTTPPATYQLFVQGFDCPGYADTPLVCGPLLHGPEALSAVSNYDQLLLPSLAIRRMGPTGPRQVSAMYRERRFTTCGDETDPGWLALPNTESREAMDLVYTRWRTGGTGVVGTEVIFDGTDAVCERAGASSIQWTQSVLRGCYTEQPLPIGDDPCLVHCGDRPNGGVWSDDATLQLSDMDDAFDHPTVKLTGDGGFRVRGYHRETPAGNDAVFAELTNVATGTTFPLFQAGGPGATRRRNNPSVTFEYDATDSHVTVVYQDRRPLGGPATDRISWASCTSTANCEAGTWTAPASALTTGDEDAAGHPTIVGHGDFQAVVYQSENADEDLRVRYIERCGATGAWSAPIDLVNPDDPDNQQSVQFGKPHIVASVVNETLHVAFVEWDTVDGTTADESSVFWVHKELPECP